MILTFYPEKCKKKRPLFQVKTYKTRRFFSDLCQQNDGWHTMAGKGEGSMIQLLPYNRRAAVAYAHKWAYNRNPAFYDFSEIGGDCTNFASQCLYAGTGIMNFTPDFGWYYIDATDRSPSWTGVPFFWEFMTRSQPTDGPIGIQVHMNFLRPGDFIQLRFESSGEVFAHTPVVVSVGSIPRPDNILIAAHSNDADYRPLDSYQNVVEWRFLHIVGAIRVTDSSTSNAGGLQGAEE